MKDFFVSRLFFKLLDFQKIRPRKVKKTRKKGQYINHERFITQAKIMLINIIL